MVVQEYDFQTWEPFPPIEESDELKRIWDGTYEKTGKDPRAGFKIAAYFVEAGMGEPDGTDVWGDLGSLRTMNRMNVQVMKSFLPQAIELGLISEEHGMKLIERIQEIAGEQYHSMLAPLVMSAWKKI